MTNWQTIETAPKDGTEVLMHIPSEAMRAFWCSDLKRWVLSHPRHREYGDDALAWMPLPAPTISHGETIIEEM